MRHDNHDSVYSGYVTVARLWLVPFHAMSSLKILNYGQSKFKQGLLEKLKFLIFYTNIYTFISRKK